MIGVDVVFMVCGVELFLAVPFEFTLAVDSAIMLEQHLARGSGGS